MRPVLVAHLIPVLVNVQVAELVAIPVRNRLAELVAIPGHDLVEVTDRRPGGAHRGVLQPVAVLVSILCNVAAAHAQPVPGRTRGYRRHSTRGEQRSSRGADHE
jgi:hypothetical protein